MEDDKSGTSGEANWQKEMDLIGHRKTTLPDRH